MAFKENDYRDRLTQQLIKQLADGVAPWQKPWNGRISHPYNPVTGKPYHGGNNLALMVEATDRGFADPRWMTAVQAQASGWQVRDGQQCALVEYWKFTDKRAVVDDAGTPVLGEDGKARREEVKLQRPRVFFARVFNATQIEGIPELDHSATTHEWDPLDRAEKILVSSGAVIHHDQGDRAFYNLLKDDIHLPRREQFPSATAYYGTALHELGHWTGHGSRLARKFGKFGDPLYAKEELRAELASFFMAERLGIPNELGRHASYVGSWIKALQEDKNEIFRASRDAEEITEYVLGMDQVLTREKMEARAKERLGRASVVNLHEAQPPVEDDLTVWKAHHQDKPDHRRVWSQRGQDGRYRLFLKDGAASTSYEALPGRSFGSASQARQRFKEIQALAEKVQESVAAASLPERISRERFSLLLNGNGVGDYQRTARFETFKLDEHRGDTVRIVAKDDEGQAWMFLGDAGLSQADIEEKIIESREAELSVEEEEVQSVGLAR
jgi:antirestriction protein ArdC